MGAAPGQARQPGFFHLAFRALRHRNYRLFLSGQAISVIGTWTQQVAMSWLVYRLTGSPFVLGATGFASQIFTLLLTPVGGVFADRWDRRRVVLATQTVFMLQALLLAALVLTGTVRVWQILVLSAIAGAANGFDVPARQAFFIQLVERKEDLSNAIALNSSAFNAGRLIGPAIAGVLVAAVGEGVCFLLNGLSYVAVLAAILRIRIPPGERKLVARKRQVLLELRNGLAYAFGSPPIRTVLLFLALVSFMGAPYSVLLPVMATEVLHGPPSTYGFLMSSTGLGALAGALFVASRTTVRGLVRIIALAGSCFGLGLLAFSLSRHTGLSMACLMFATFGLMVQTSSSNTIIQTIVDDDKRGRVMSFYTMSVIGMAPLGSLCAGTAASLIGAPATIGLGGAACLAGALWFSSRIPALRELIRPIYVKLGIIPDPAAGFQPAPDLNAPSPGR